MTSTSKSVSAHIGSKSYWEDCKLVFKNEHIVYSCFACHRWAGQQKSTKSLEVHRS